MYLQIPTNPVENAYAGGDSIAVRRLQEFCASTQSNFITIQAEVTNLQDNLQRTYTTNQRIIQFMNWLAVTNPHILDEFQTTANAFEKLAPRGEPGPECETSAA